MFFPKIQTHDTPVTWFMDDPLVSGRTFSFVIEVLFFKREFGWFHRVQHDIKRFLHATNLKGYKSFFARKTCLIRFVRKISRFRYYCTLNSYVCVWRKRGRQSRDWLVGYWVLKMAPGKWNILGQHDNSIWEKLGDVTVSPLLENLPSIFSFNG